MKIVFQLLEDSTRSARILDFVEVEDNTGKSIDAGEWGKDPSRDLETLTISVDAHIAALASSLLELEHRNALEAILASTSTPRAWQRLTPDEVELLARYREGNMVLVEAKGDPVD